METTQTTIEKLSIEFSKLVRENFTAQELNDVITKNSTKEYSNACATHDYCDANMLMNEAFTNVMGREFVFNDDEIHGSEAQNEHDTHLINKAWYLSKSLDFKNVSIEVGTILKHKIQKMRKGGTMFIGYAKVKVTSYDGITLKADGIEELVDEVTGATVADKNDRITFLAMNEFSKFFKF